MSQEKVVDHNSLEDDTKQHVPHVPEDAKILEVTNADLALALSTGPKLKATSRESIQLFLLLSVAFMGSMSNGFDGQGRLPC